MFTDLSSEMLSSFMRASSIMKSAAGQLGAGECHVDVEVGVVVDVDTVDQPEAVNVDGNLGVEYRAEHFDDPFLRDEVLFRCPWCKFKHNL